MLNRLLLSVGLLVSFSLCAATGSETVLVCYPGGSVNANDANGAMTSMLRVVERVGQWQENSFNSLFTTKVDECKTQMAENNPKFAITSLGLFLALREQYHLLPVVQPKIKGQTSERYRLLVLKDKYQNIEDLKGKSLGGTVLEELPFLGKIVFAGQYDPNSFFELKPSNQAIRALRSVAKGELDATILNGQQFDALSSLHLENPLETIFTSEEIPLMGMVANTKTTTTEERERFAKALEGMCDDTEGKKLCELFGVDAFVAVDPALFEPMVKLWSSGQ